MDPTRRIVAHPVLLLVAGLLAVQPAHAEDIPTKTIAETWQAHGEGVVRFQNRMLFMMEHASSKGVMVVSPQAYKADVTLRYEIMPMNPASVCVAILAASDGGDGASLTLPEGYDGGMGPWTRDLRNYFVAFHNAAHDRTPFAVRYPGGVPIGEHPAPVLRSGQFHAIEIVRRGGALSLAVDGTRLFEGRDAEPLGGGRIAFRLRGIDGIAAACLIRKVSISEE